MPTVIYLNKKQEDFLRGLDKWVVFDCDQRKAYNEIINKLDATKIKPKKKDGLIFELAETSNGR